jgi:DNA mismatch repair protein MSH6
VKSSLQRSKNSLWWKLQVGSRVGIYWKDDKCYYPCTVEKLEERTEANPLPSRFFVRYDDGETEWTDMAVEKIRLLEDDAEFEDQEEKVLSPGRKRRRSLIESDDDGDEEEQEWQDPGDEEESEDDGSVFDNVEEVEEEEEDEDNWMVTDDELEDSPKKKKKQATKKKASLKVTHHSPPPTTSTSETPPPSKRVKLSSTANTSSSTSYKTPLKNFSYTVSPNTSSSQKSKTKPLTVASSRKQQVTQTPSPAHSKHKPSAARDKRKHPHLPDEPLPTNDQKGALNVRGAHVHNHLNFLRFPRDSQGRHRDHPDYDGRTLMVQEGEWKKITGTDMTAAVKQWWDLKSQYFDTILLFKTGKFYEMFHTDADVGVELLGFIYMKGKVAHAGFPEISYGQFADKLVRAGYKVARVEQTETPDMLKVRKAQTPRSQKKPKVVNREVCSVMTLGTRTFCALDDSSALLAAEANGGATDPCGPLLAIREEQLEAPEEDDGSDEDNVKPVCEYGITVVDAIRGTVTLGMFADDVLRNRLRTLLACFDPSEILLPANASKELRSLVEGHRATARNPCRLEVIRDQESFPKSTALNRDHARDLERGRGPNRIVEPWSAKETLSELHRRKYYPRGSRKAGDQSISRWPAVLQMVVEGEADLCLSSFGAALYYLQRNLIDREILSMGIVRAYIPQESQVLESISSSDDQAPASQTKEGFWTKQQKSLQISNENPEMKGKEFEENLEENPLFKIPTNAPVEEANSLSNHQGAHSEDRTTHMSLDGTTLHNLEILTNAVDFKTSGSLWSKLNHTKSPHGARMLKAWLLRPLFKKAEIDRRTDAVEELTSGSGALALQELREVLAKVGDLDRLLSRIHSMSSGVNASGAYDDTDGGSQAESHPNERAVLYEGPAYTKRKVKDFKNVLKGLQKACRIPEIFADVSIDSSSLLYRLVRPLKDQDGGYFPDMEESLDWFTEHFDCDKAANGQFVPGRGTDPIYDEACDTINRVKEELENYKQDMIKTLKPRHVASRAWKYINTKPESKDKYLIELPVTVEVPHDFKVKAKRGSGMKQVNKYRTDYVADLVRTLEQALEVQQARRAKGMQIVFAKFDAHRPLWASAAHITALLDALGSLAIMAGSPGYCRAEILECPSDGSVKPCIDIVQGRHPVVENTFHTSEFIPNDLRLGPSDTEDGGDAARLLLLSGPNMGGKSTMLRQTCLIAILAQIGSYVPAESCRLTPIDCIFTRLGASDRILLGQSTFFVELAETAAALRGATRRSLVIMDELGRGTSTFDGTAIASATVKHLVERSQCLTLFATHYHSLLDEWKNAPNVRLGHMQCLVDEMEESEGSNSNITFLYTLGPGSCPKSFGINVAKLAGLPEEVLANAKRVSAEFEDEMNGGGEKATEEEARAITTKLQSLIASEQYDDILKLWKDARIQCDIK